MNPDQKKNKYWLSLEQWKDEKTFHELAQKEFASPPVAPEDGEWGRREFLKLMGASLALSSLSCLRRPAETIVPYVQRPEDVIPGQMNKYASSYYDGGEGFGLIVQTREGRPIQLEGLSRQGLSARAHSHLLALYDPDRIKTAKRNLFNKDKSNKETITAYLDETDPLIAEQLKKEGLALLTDFSPSPASAKILTSFSQSFKAQHFTWDPLGLELLAQSYKECFGGPPLVPYYRLEKSRLTVSVNCDILGTFLSPAKQTHNFALSRKPDQKMSRLIVFESLMSLTGTNADERHRISPSENIHILLTLIDEVLKIENTHSQIRELLNKQRKQLPALTIENKVREAARELVQHKGESLVLCGGSACQTNQARSLFILTHFLNDVLGNTGKTIDDNSYHTAWSSSAGSMTNLIEQLESKKIKTVIIHRTNPMYSYPDVQKLSSALRQAEMVIYTGDRMDETAQVSDYIIPDLHDLEKWTAWEFQKGELNIQQPTIRPLIESRAFEENLIIWSRMAEKNPLQKVSSWHSYLKSHLQQKGVSWNRLLETGFYKIKTLSKKHASFKLNVLKNIKITPETETDKSFELVLYATQGLRDGRLANVSWLQEFPDPVTKICWGNYLCISPQTARAKGLKEGQTVKIQSAGFVQTAPVHIQPGQDDRTLGLALGYGRTSAGQTANGVGVNAYSFMKISQGERVFSGLSAKITPMNKHIPLAVVQGHHSMEGRQIVVETTLQKYLKNPASGIHKHKIFSLWSEHKYTREKWAMVIDLNSCTGCGACITACQSENNVPVVGKKYVLQGREMHWLRVDRYYTGEPENPKSVVHQPVVCMHCENAPCETVCPVAATVHSDEGTNDMIYNRCVGTRYCSNNCPYKVRRFNWFNYSKKFQNPLNGALNPDVTVRSRGVMEKCTFCIHRVKTKQAAARLKGTPLKDGDIQTACQQSCPANAIVFGNFNDKNSKVRQAFEQANAYSLLEELNTKPSVRYRTKIRNKKEDPSTHEEEHHG